MEKFLYALQDNYRDSRTPEQTEYMVNCAKKHYGESKKEVMA